MKKVVLPKVKKKNVKQMKEGVDTTKFRLNIEQQDNDVYNMCNEWIIRAANTFKKENTFKAIFKAIFYNDNRTKFSRSTLGFIICMVIALFTIILSWTIIAFDFFVNKKINTIFVGIVTGHTIAVTGGGILNYFGGKKLKNKEVIK